MRSSYDHWWSLVPHDKSHLLVLTDPHNKSELKEHLHDMVIDRLSRHDSVVYSAERDTRKALSSLSRLATAKHVKPIQKYLANESLIVMRRDALPTIAPQGKSRRSSRRLSIVNRNRAASYDLPATKAKSCTIIRDPTVLAETSSIQDFVAFERESARDFSKPINLICVYQNSECIDRLSFSDLISVVTSHTGIIHNRWWYRPLSHQILLELVRDRMIGVLGESTIELVFKTLKLVYGLDEEAIIAKPSLFESRLGKLLGSRTAQMMFEMVANQIRDELSYSTGNERDLVSK